MGDEVDERSFTRADRTRHRAKVRRNLDAFARMLREHRFASGPACTGLEMELNLVDEDGRPALRNADVLEEVSDPDFVTELGQFNLEVNVPPRLIEGDGLQAYEDGLRASLNAAEEKASAIGAHMVCIGILPTLEEGHLAPHTISGNPRYRLLSDQILAARGEDIGIDIVGVDGPGGEEHLRTTSESIMPEAACTSAQFHIQVSPEDFGRYWNASQVVAGVQVALGANSPYLFGRELWRETRVPLFTQATDTRSPELVAQGVRPRVWFGEGWATDVFDLLEQNVRFFGGLLPVVDDEDPMEELDKDRTPTLPELRMHNGTIYRWNRPVYDVVDGTPHLRIENRVMPSGPTVVDTIANAAFYFGLVRAIAEHERPPWTRMSFSAAEENFDVAAREGIDATVYWPGVGRVPATELVLRRLLPLAAEGLASWGVDGHVADRYLGAIEQRCVRGVNGASWFVARVHAAQRAGEGRDAAVAHALRDYRLLMHTNEPVHAWPAQA